jgi:hypothetical protein
MFICFSTVLMRRKTPNLRNQRRIMTIGTARLRPPHRAVQRPHQVVVAAPPLRRKTLTNHHMRGKTLINHHLRRKTLTNHHMMALLFALLLIPGGAPRRLHGPPPRPRALTGRTAFPLRPARCRNPASLRFPRRDCGWSPVRSPRMVLTTPRSCASTPGQLGNLRCTCSLCALVHLSAFSCPSPRGTSTFTPASIPGVPLRFPTGTRNADSSATFFPLHLPGTRLNCPHSLPSLNARCPRVTWRSRAPAHLNQLNGLNWTKFIAQH